MIFQYLGALLEAHFDDGSNPPSSPWNGEIIAAQEGDQILLPKLNGTTQR